MTDNIYIYLMVIFSVNAITALLNLIILGFWAGVWWVVMKKCFPTRYFEIFQRTMVENEKFIKNILCLYVYIKVCYNLNDASIDQNIKIILQLFYYLIFKRIFVSMIVTYYPRIRNLTFGINVDREQRRVTLVTF